MREVPLSRGMVALVDDDDYQTVTAVGKWYANPSDRTFYARKNFWTHGRCWSLRMHTFITGWSYVDHVNGNGLDNQRSNLRLADGTLNAMNRGQRSDNTSGFKGVWFRKQSGRWVACVGANGQRHFLGQFDSPQAAARAYDLAAIRLHGPFARLNFPPGDQL